MEGISNPEQSGNTQPLYRERVSSEHYIQQSLDSIDKLAKGEGVLNLTEADREEIRTFEAELESTLLPIYNLTVKTSVLEIGFLATPEGRELFSANTDLTLPIDKEEIRRFLYQNSQKLSSVKTEKRKELNAAGNQYLEDRIFETLLSHVDDEGNLYSTEFEPEDKVTLLLNPDLAERKIEGLRSFKKFLKENYFSLDNDEASLGKKEIIDLYLHRVNLMIVNLMDDVRSLEKKTECLGMEGLTSNELSIFNSEANASNNRKPQERRERNAARFDKFKFGADNGYTEGERLQIGPEIQKYAEEIDLRWIKSVTERRKKIESQGLDYAKLFKKEIPPEERKTIVIEQLRGLGLYEEVTEEDGETQDKAKYYARVKKGAKAASNDPKKRCINIADTTANLVTCLAVESGHEMGHALQTVNGSQIPLKIFDRIGGGGNSAFSEGGAIAVESKITEEFFGYEVTNHPHYIRAMLARQNGADYNETIRVFYQSAIRPAQIMVESGDLTREEFKEEIKKSLSLAVNRCQRLFRGGNKNSDTNYLTSSKDTAYVDQLILAEKMRDREKDYLLLVRGMSFENIKTLLKLGMLSVDQIKEPDYEYLRNVWEKLKSKYLLEPSSTS